MGGEHPFVDPSRGDFRLWGDSPLINGGENVELLLDALDLDGKPRIIDGTVDQGAYEHFPASRDTDGDGLPDEWEWRYTGSVTGAYPHALGADTVMSFQEHFIVGTDPNDPASGFLLQEVARTPGGFPVLEWPSYPRRLYDVYRLSDLIHETPALIAQDIPATPPLNTFIDEGASGEGPWFYRIRVRFPE